MRLDEWIFELNGFSLVGLIREVLEIRRFVFPAFVIIERIWVALVFDFC